MYIWSKDWYWTGHTRISSNEALQITKQVVTDNESFIIGNVAEYLLNEAANAENGWLWYLSGAETADYETGNSEKYIIEIKNFLLANFNYNI